MAAAGACRTANRARSSTPRASAGRRAAARDAAAKAVCATCPVIAQCAAHALSVREPYGVWGGLSEDEREAADRSRAATSPAAS